MRKLGGGLLATAAVVIFLSEARSQYGASPITSTQTPQSSAFFSQMGQASAVNPRQLTFTKIDTSKAMQAPNLSGAFAKPPQPTPIGLNGMFPKISLGSWPPKLPNVSILPSSPFSTVTPKK